MEPFVKWAGGKRWLAGEIGRLFVSDQRVVEPFVGGGALFFHLEPGSGLLADINAELVETYRAVQDDVEDVISRLEGLSIDRSTYERFRRAQPKTAPEIAARFIYLNRTAFNGLYRVNQRGEFNVPFGCKPTTTPVDASHLRACAEQLQHATVRSQHFTETIRDCTHGDFVYLDPPYTVKHNSNGFIRYNQRLFSWRDQETLAGAAAELADSGIDVVVSNADHSLVHGLYPEDLFVRTQVGRTSRMAASVAHRVRTTEVLIVARHMRERLLDDEHLLTHR